MRLPDTDTARSITNLQSVRDWERVRAWVQQSYQSVVDDVLSATDPVRVHQLQGEARALKDFLQATAPASPTALPHLG